MNKTALPHAIAIIARPGYNWIRPTTGRNRFPDMLTAPAIRSEARPSAIPDLSREALLARLHFPASWTYGLEHMLDLPPISVLLDGNLPPRSPRQPCTGGDSGAGLTGGLPSNLLLIATGWDGQLLPLSSYQELRARMEQRLEAHALLREHWLGILLHRLPGQTSDIAPKPPPEEEALRRQWQSRLEVKPAPTLPEYMGIAKDPELARWKREAYRQAAVA